MQRSPMAVPLMPARTRCSVVVSASFPARITNAARALETRQHRQRVAQHELIARGGQVELRDEKPEYHIISRSAPSMKKTTHSDRSAGGRRQPLLQLGSALRQRRIGGHCSE